MVHHQTMKPRRVIDELRQRFPGEWRYDGPNAWKRGDGGRARWTAQLADGENDLYTSRLYYYPFKGTPVLVCARDPRPIFKET